jgi:hypothetical protein
MRLRPFVWIIVFLILIAGALAIGQIQTNTPILPTSLTIVYPKAECLTIGSNLTIPFDVLDSNFTKLSDATTSCAYYIGDSNGMLIAYGTPVYDSIIRIWSFDVDGSITTAGEYSFYIYCNETESESGFASLSYEASYLGICAPDDKTPLAALILIPILFGILLMIGSFVLDDDHKTLKIALFIFSYLTVFISLWFGLSTIGRYYGFYGMQDNIGTAVWVFGIFLFVILSYFLIYAFIMGIHLAAQKKQEKVYGR